MCGDERSGDRCMKQYAGRKYPNECQKGACDIALDVDLWIPMHGVEKHKTCGKKACRSTEFIGPGKGLENAVHQKGGGHEDDGMRLVGEAQRGGGDRESNGCGRVHRRVLHPKEIRSPDRERSRLRFALRTGSAM